MLANFTQGGGVSDHPLTIPTSTLTTHIPIGPIHAGDSLLEVLGEGGLAPLVGVIAECGREEAMLPALTAICNLMQVFEGDGHKGFRHGFVRGIAHVGFFEGLAALYHQGGTPQEEAERTLGLMSTCGAPRQAPHFGTTQCDSILYSLYYRGDMQRDLQARGYCSNASWDGHYVEIPCVV
jgi:hypothetical protein